MAAAAGFCWLLMASACSYWRLPAPAVFCLLLLFSTGSSILAVSFPGLWWPEFHAEKEMGTKLLGASGFAVAVAAMLGEYALPAVIDIKIWVNRHSIANY